MGISTTTCTNRNRLEVVVTEHSISRAVCQSFVEGCNGVLVSPDECGPRIATYGIKRGSGDAIHRAEEYWHIDNGYFMSSNHSRPATQGKHSFGGYYRITHNGTMHSGDGDYPKDRFNKLVKEEMRDWRKTGDHIVLIPPSTIFQKFLGIHGPKPSSWLKNAFEEIQKYTDRRVLVSTKFANGWEDSFPKGMKKIPSENPYRKVIENAWALVTYNSNCMTDAVVKGIPIISLSPERKIGSIEEIENPPMDREFLYGLAYQQWTLEEMRTGQAWRELNP